MADEDPRDAELLLQVVDQVQDLRLHGDVERGDRLVGHDQLGLDRERPRDADALALAAAQMARVAAGDRGGQLDQLEQLGHASRDGLARPHAVDAHGLGEHRADLQPRVQRRVRILEDHLQRAPPLSVAGVALDYDLAARRLLHPHDQPSERRLPAPALADDAQRLRFPDRERHPVDGVQLEALAAQQPLPERRLQLVDLAQVAGREQRGGLAVHGDPTLTREPLVP